MIMITGSTLATIDAPWTYAIHVIVSHARDWYVRDRYRVDCPIPNPTSGIQKLPLIYNIAHKKISNHCHTFLLHKLQVHSINHVWVSKDYFPF